MLPRTVHTNMAGLGQKMAVTQLAAVQNPAVGLLLSVLIIAAVVIVWAAMTLRMGVGPESHAAACTVRA